MSFQTTKMVKSWVCVVFMVMVMQVLMGGWNSLPLTPPTGLGNFALFGKSVAADGNHVIIGAPGANSSGIVYVYRSVGKEDISFRLIASLSHPMPRIDDSFGFVVAAQGNRIVVGAYGVDVAIADEGAVYIYIPANDTDYQLVSRLTAPSTAPVDRFGLAVDIYNNTIVVGAPNTDIPSAEAGSIYIFKENQPNNWTFSQHIINPNSSEIEFGTRVRVYQQFIGVSTFRANNFSGLVYIYNQVGNQFTLHQVLSPTSLAPRDRFGIDFDFSGSYLFVGADRDGEKGQASGTVHVFKVISGVFTLQTQLFPSDARFGNTFGATVAADGDQVAVGSPGSDGSSANEGAAYVFKLVNGQWTQFVKLLPDRSSNGDSMGTSLAYQDGYVVAGAHNADLNGTSSGDAFVFSFSSKAPVTTTGDVSGANKLNTAWGGLF